MNEALKTAAVALLRELIETPSVSRQETATADLLAGFLTSKGVSVERKHNNVWAFNHYYDSSKPTILLNSHHDTVAPNGGYTKDPFAATVADGKLYGLGSNDAGASLVGLTALFLALYEQPALRYNLCLALTAEEEVSGRNGIESILPEIGSIDFAVVGEPTSMDVAVAERGLMVLDCVAKGIPGHAAHSNTLNPIHLAVADLRWFSTHTFDKTSALLGAVKMSVTVIHSGTQHNTVPAECSFTVDVRTNECYSNTEILDIIRSSVACEVTPRSVRLNPSSIDPGHPLVKLAIENGCKVFGSNTLSDQALMPFPSVKWGIGNSLRSHTADEYVEIKEIEHGIDVYIAVFSAFLL